MEGKRTLPLAVILLLALCPLGAGPSPQTGSAEENTAEHVGPSLRIVKAEPAKRLVLQHGSRLWIKGSTTKHDFTLKAGVLLGSAILKAPLDPSQGQEALLSVVQTAGIQAMDLAIPVGELRSTDPKIDNRSDYALIGPFYSLKGKDNPNVQFRLEEQTLKAGSGRGLYSVDAKGKLAVAGMTRDIALKAKAVFHGDQVHLTGAYTIRFEDFNIRYSPNAWGKMRPSASVVVHYDLLFGPEPPAKTRP